MNRNRSRSHKQSVRVGFNAPLNGQDVDIEFTRTTAWSPEHYGADADGNRGMWIDSIDEDEATDITVDDKPLSALSTLEEAEVRRLVDAWMEATPPEAEEQPEPEPEPDYDEPDYWDEGMDRW